jgi:hypothetical protein
MISFIQYEYYIEREKCAVTGEYLLFRNELLSDSYANKHYKYSNCNASDSDEIYVGTTPPVAFGITAFFYGGIGKYPGIYIQLLRNHFFDSFEYYQVYYNVLTKKAFLENNRNPVKSEPGVVEYSFLKTHIPNERELFERSSIFYEELNDNLNFEIKLQLKSYFNGYIQWLEEKYYELQAKYDPIPSPELRKVDVHKPDHMDDIRFVDLDDESFIKVVEWVFKFIEELFQAQVNPESNREFMKILFFPIEKGIVYSYSWEIDNDILDPKVFRARISKMLLSKDVDNEGLKILLNQCYKYAKNISEIFDHQFTEKMLFGNHLLSIQFNHIKRELGFLGTVPPSSHYTQYSNFDLARISAIIVDFLEIKLGMSGQDFSRILPDPEKDKSLKTEPLNREITSYFNKIEASLIFIKEIFELQLNPDINFRRASDLGIYENRNTQFKYEFFAPDELLNLELFKATVGALILNNSVSKAGLKLLLKKHLDTANQITQLFDNHIQVTTWDRTLLLNARYIGSYVECSVDDYPNENYELSYYYNNELAAFADQLHSYLKSVLFPDKPTKQSKDKRMNFSFPESVDDAKPITSIHPTPPLIIDPITDYLNFIQDIEEFLAFILCKLSLYPDTPDQLEFLKNSPNHSEWKDPEFLVKTTTPALVPSTFITKTRQIRFGKVLTDAELFPMLEKIHTTVTSIFDLCKHTPSDRSFTISLILPGKRNKVGPQVVEDDYDYDHYVYLSEVKLLEFCKQIFHFLKTEIFENRHQKESIMSVKVKLGVETESALLDNPVEEDSFELNKYLEEQLSPLSISENTDLPCIDGAFKTYLVSAIQLLSEENKLLQCKSKYPVRCKKAFYKTLREIRYNQFIKDTFLTKDFNLLISAAIGTTPKRVYNALSEAAKN